MSEQQIVVFTDGASKGNPGPGGWGVVIVTPEGHVTERGGGAAMTTNNRMELTGAIRAFEHLQGTRGTVAVYTDSTYVIRGITEWVHGWKRRGWKTATGADVMNRELWERLDGLTSARGPRAISWHYVRGHVGIPGNERADEIVPKAVAAKDVAAIRVSFSNSHLVILKNHSPETAIAAKFSIEFALACALLNQRVGLRDLTDKFVRSAAVRDLIKRVAIDINPVEEAGTSGYAPYDSVQLKLADGTVLDSAQVRHAKGDPQAPLSTDELWVKFDDCVAWSKLKLDSKKLFAQLQQLEQLKAAGALFARRAS